jgi:hypothetical protein
MGTYIPPVLAQIHSCTKITYTIFCSQIVCVRARACVRVRACGGVFFLFFIFILWK